MSSLERAIMIAAVAHEGHLDEANEPYLLRVLRVMLKMDDHQNRIVAALHGVVDDNPRWSLERLRGEGFSERIVQAVDSLSRRPGEFYETFIERVSRDPVARLVKIADLEEQSDLSRLPEPSEEDFERLEKYQRALVALQAGTWT